MYRRVMFLWVLSLILFVFIIQCSREDIVFTEKESAALSEGPGPEGPSRGLLGRGDTVYCNSVECIEGFDDDWTGRGYLIIESGEYEIDERLCFQHSAPPHLKMLDLLIAGDDHDYPPTLELATCFSEVELHASLFCAGGTQPNDLTYFKDIIIKHDCYMDRAGICREYSSKQPLSCVNM